MIKIYGFQHPDFQETTKEEIFTYFKEKEWVEFEIDFPEVLPDKVLKFSKLIAEKHQLKT